MRHRKPVSTKINSTRNISATDNGALNAALAFLLLACLLSPKEAVHQAIRLQSKHRVCWRTRSFCCAVHTVHTLAHTSRTATRIWVTFRKKLFSSLLVPSSFAPDVASVNNCSKNNSYSKPRNFFSGTERKDVKSFDGCGQTPVSHQSKFCPIPSKIQRRF